MPQEKNLTTCPFQVNRSEFKPSETITDVFLYVKLVLPHVEHHESEMQTCMSSLLPRFFFLLITMFLSFICAVCKNYYYPPVKKVYYPF